MNEMNLPFDGFRMIEGYGNEVACRLLEGFDR